MLHEMRLHPGPFAAVRSGKKTIEARLFDGKRKKIKLGDEIIFWSRGDARRSIRVKVVGLLRYPTFSALFTDFRPVVFGGKSTKALEKQASDFYTKEEEKKLGVVGIRIALME